MSTGTKLTHFSTITRSNQSNDATKTTVTSNPTAMQLDNQQLSTSQSITKSTDIKSLSNNEHIYTLHRRAVRRPLGGRRDIHITRKGNFQGLKSKIITLIRESPNIVQLHALGAAITRCCDIALAVKQECHDQIEIHIQTSTVTVTDDFEPNIEVCKC